VKVRGEIRCVREIYPPESEFDAAIPTSAAHVVSPRIDRRLENRQFIEIALKNLIRVLVLVLRDPP